MLRWFGGAAAGRAALQLAGPRLRIGDELRQRLHRQLRADDQHLRRAETQADRGEILRRIVGHPLHDQRVDGQRAVRAQQQRVPVRLGPGDDLGADIAAGACAVLDDDRLAEAFRHAGDQHARQGVEVAAGAEGHHQAERPVGEAGLRTGQRGRGEAGARASAARRGIPAGQRLRAICSSPLARLRAPGASQPPQCAARQGNWLPCLWPWPRCCGYTPRNAARAREKGTVRG